MARILNTLILLTLVLNVSHALRILMFATNLGFSHLEFTGKLADLLVDAGHEVDYVLSVLNSASKHNGTKKANLIRHEGRNVQKVTKILSNAIGWKDAFAAEWNNKQLTQFGQIIKLNCEGILTDKNLMELLNSRNYTVGIAEYYDACAWAVFHLLKIKSFHELNASPLNENTHFVHGFPFDIRNVPIFQNQLQVGPISTTFDFLYNFYEYLNARYFARVDQFEPTNKLLRKLIDANHPTISEMQRESAYVFVNTHEFTEFARATSPKVKYIGGIAVKKPEKLNEETARVFERAKSGVVLVSFGSIVDTTNITPKKRDEMLQAFARFPDYQFIWRLTKVDKNMTDIINRYPNVNVFSWVQQASILAHPKTRAFISHMGLNSYNEAAHYGVPIVAVPFFADQTLNAVIAVKRGIAVQISRKEMSTELLSNALNEILHTLKYRERSLEIKAKINNWPEKPEEVFVKHVEFAAKFGSLDELKLDTAGESIFEQFYLDVIGLGLLFLVVVYLIVRHIIRMFLLVGIHSSAVKTKKID